MNVPKYYYASFNVGNVTAWETGMYLEKESVFLEIEESLEEIAENISKWTSFLDEDKIIEYLKLSLKDLKEYGIYRDKYDTTFDFFILEEYVWKNIHERKISK